MSSTKKECPRCEQFEDELAGLRILAGAWGRVSTEARASALQSLIDDPANLSDKGPGPREGWMEDLLRTIDEADTARRHEREECAKMVDAMATRCFGLRASMGRDLRVLAADIRARGAQLRSPCKECHGSGLLFDLTGLIQMPCPTCAGSGAA